MSTSNLVGQSPVVTSPLTAAHAAAPSLSPTTSSRSQTSPSMPSSSSSHPQTAHSLSSSESNERQIAEARAFLAASMNNIGSSLDRTLQERARNLHDNSKVLEKQQKDVGKATEGLRKENEKLTKMANEGSKKVKELGNVQNWAEMLERDFLVLGEWVRLVDGGSESGSESGSSWTDSDGDEDSQHLGKEFSGDANMSDLEHTETGTVQEEHGGNTTTTEIPLFQNLTDARVDTDGDLQMQGTLQNVLQEEPGTTADAQLDKNMETKFSPGKDAEPHISQEMYPAIPEIESTDFHHTMEVVPSQIGNDAHHGCHVPTSLHEAHIDDVMEDTPSVQIGQKSDSIIAEQHNINAEVDEGSNGDMISNDNPVNELSTGNTPQKPEDMGIPATI